MQPLKKVSTLSIEESAVSENAVYMYSRGKTLQFQGLFSFAFYYHTMDKPVQETHWYRGLNLYLQIAHNPEYAFYKDVGIVIYTDLHTFHILKDIEEWKQYPKLVFAVTVWQRYQAESNQVEGTVIRCMRYHALQAFPTAWIAIRDADTLFQKELGFRTGLWGTSYMNDMKPTLLHEIALWEQTFLHTFFNSIKQSICIGVGIYYERPWHANIKRNYILKMNKTIHGKYDSSNHKNPRKNIIFKSKYGAYAGFVTCKAEPLRPANIWKNIVEYLTTRYKIILYENKRMISNALQKRTVIGKDERILLFSFLPHYLEECYFFSFSNDMGDYSLSSFYNYAQTSKWTSEKYNSMLKNFQKLPLLDPKSIAQVLQHNTHKLFYNYFKQRMQEYKTWLETYDEKEPEYRKIYLSKLQKVKPGYEQFIDGPYELPMVGANESNVFLNVPTALEPPENTLNLQNVYDGLTKLNTNFLQPINTNLPTNGAPVVPSIKLTRCKAGKCTVMGGTRKHLRAVRKKSNTTKRR